MYVDEDARDRVDSVKDYLRSIGQTGASRSDALREMYRIYKEYDKFKQFINGGKYNG